MLKKGLFFLFIAMNTASFCQTNLTVGTKHQGGVIFYIFKLGDKGFVKGQVHGLIAAPTDQGQAEWGCSGKKMNALGDKIGDGKSNTAKIVKACAFKGAAKICDDLVIETYSDWFLPSKAELKALYAAKAAVGGLTDNSYWTSTEYEFKDNWTNACFSHFNTGDQSNYNKKSISYIRAIRQF